MKIKAVLTLLMAIIVLSCSKNKELPNVDVYGHAGTSLHRERSVFPANSFESIQYAIDALGADGVEVDVQMTKDSVLVLYHDPVLDISSSFSGCINDYNYEEISTLTLDNTSYVISKFDRALIFAESRNVLIYADVKTYTYCGESTISMSAFQYALNQSLESVSIPYKDKIYLGMLNLEFLKEINHPKKCYEFSNVASAIQKASENDFDAVIFHNDLITESESNLLINSGLYWGVFGIKDAWTIDGAIGKSPNFVITDNIAYSNQISN